MRKITLEQLPLSAEKKFLKVQVYYNPGGMNIFLGSTQKRGFYLSVTPVEIDGNFTKTLAFSGTCALVKESARFSAKQLQEVADSLNGDPIYQKLVDHVMAKNNLQFASEVQATAT